jgi:hypothetical protein
MKKLIPIFFSAFIVTLLLATCRKDGNVAKKSPKANIIISEELAAENIYNYFGSNEKYNVVDTFIVDTAFYLFKNPIAGGYYQNGPRLYFKAKFDTNYNVQYEWKVGTDPLIRQTSSFALDFGQPVGDINIRLISKYSPKSSNGLPGVDTIYQKIFLGENSPLFGDYEGYNTDSPNHTFKIKIGWQFDSNQAINRSYFSISNLPEGFPIKSEIIPRSSSFGISGETFHGQYLLYQGLEVNAVYALGFMNKKNESITIRYNYGIINNYATYVNVYDWSKVIVKTFVGKKV